MQLPGWRLFALAAAAGLSVCTAHAASTVEAPRAAAPIADEDPFTPDARQVAHWVLASGDNHGRPFAIVDKKNARLFVLAAGGRLLGATPALLGEAVGDDTVPGVGDKPPSQVLPEERTTPAGRFDSEPGRNLGGEHVVWVDYDAGFAIHRLRRGASEERRRRSLASATPDDNRASLGCVVVDPGFYERVVMPALGVQPAVVYVLPETRPLTSLIGGGGDTRLVLQ
jgi:hypothetical protein